MNWIVLAVMTAFFYGTYNFFIKISSGHINQIVGALILQIVAALLGAGVLLVMKLRSVPLEITNKGIGYAVLAGVFVGLAEIFSFIVFSKGVSVSVGISVIIGGSVFFGALLGLFFLREILTLWHYVGILMIIGGIVMLSTQG